MYHRKDNRPGAPVTIYALKHNGVTIYIGQTCDTETRLKTHKARRDFPKPITMEALEITTAEKASGIEREWIRRAGALGVKLFNGEGWYDMVCRKCRTPLPQSLTTRCPECASE
ncbi:hypothetical protein [Armatimonas sp.]|uniref:hypothetical protein n=1 Tax=Armatimonas sp. TaxID=1872638 RepID=UPI00374CA51E